MCCFFFFLRSNIHFFLKLLFIFGCTGSSIACRGFSSWGERELLFVVVCGVLLLRRTGSGHEGFSSCDTGALLLQGMWNLPRPGIKPMSPALAGGFLPTAPLGTSHLMFLCTRSLQTMSEKHPGKPSFGLLQLAAIMQVWSESWGVTSS